MIIVLEIRISPVPAVQSLIHQPPHVRRRNGGFMNLHFGPWADDCHNSLEQIKRLSAAQKIPAAKIAVDSEKRTAVIAGSGSSPYQVTLDACTCPDFNVRRQAPCKHIYRLALELNLLDGVPVFSKEAAKSFDSAAEVERFRALWESGAISAETFVKIADALTKKK